MNQNLQKVKEEKLTRKINTIKRYFDVDKVISIKTNTASIAKYYKVNRLAYSIFHNRNDFIHMGISQNGQYREEDLLGQPKIVEAYIGKLRARNVLELATGRGASTFYLAKRYPNVSFYANDLPDSQIEYAYKKAKKVKNFYLTTGDYHDLSDYPSNYFEIVFIFEAICHSTNKQKVVNEVKRVLRRGGAFIIIDGYLNKPLIQLTKEELTAKKLTEKGMMVEEFELYDKFRTIVLKKGFKVLDEKDVSIQIIPTLKRFEKQVMRLFSLPKIVTKIIIQIFPDEFINNALSGYLMPDLINLGIAKYMILIVTKK